MPLSLGRRQWRELAIRSLRALLGQELAVVWPEVEAKLYAGGWVHEHVDRTIPTGRGPDPHILHEARDELVNAGDLEEQSAFLQGIRVSAWVDAAARRRRQATAVDHAAAAKRRLYRRFLTWTGDSSKCGHVAEEVVATSMASLRGRFLWIPPSARLGNIQMLEGRPLIVGGPLDPAGHWARDPENVASGFTPFAVEVKNLRSVIYPWDHEMWDLLAKLAAFPDVVPVLVARRLHPISFRFLKDVGGLGCELRNQLFTGIDPTDFHRVVTALSFEDARQVPDTSVPLPRLVTFFSRSAYAPDPETDRPLMVAQAQKWEVAAPIASEFPDLRDVSLHAGERRRRWFEFARAIVDAGLYERQGWAPEGAAQHDNGEVG